MGSGANRDNIESVLREGDGVIVSTSLEKSPAVIDPEKAKAFVEAARSL